MHCEDGDDAVTVGLDGGTLRVHGGEQQMDGGRWTPPSFSPLSPLLRVHVHHYPPC